MTEWADEVNPGNALPEYPRPSMVRQDWMNLNGLWDYAVTNANATEMPAPDGKILVPYPIESALSGVRRQLQPDERLWYEREFTIPESWKGQKVLLHFDAVDFETEVWLNGNPVGEHKGGYDRFTFDITDGLKADGSQKLKVSVRDVSNSGQQAVGKQNLHPAGSSYTTTSGIWQTVWLEPVPESSVVCVRVTPDVDNSSVTFAPEIAGGAESFEVKVHADGKMIAKVAGAAGTAAVIHIPTPRLWSPSDPFLYDYTVTLKGKEKRNDKISGYFGMRKTSLAKDGEGITRLALNNEFLFQMGPLDQGFWPDGLHTPPTDDALKYDIEFVKSVGFNMIRKHLKIESERWYYWADKLGVLVWQDFPCGKFETRESRVQWEKEIVNYVGDHYNHPSIVMWVVFNEGWGQYDNQRLVNMVRSLDETRLVSNSSGWYDVRWGDVVDEHFYPGPGSPFPEEKRASVTGEFGGLGFTVPGHVWTEDTWGYHNFSTADSLADAYVKLWQRTHMLKREKWLSAAIYTQISDIETETNGIMTYDRKVAKIDPGLMLAAHTDALPRPRYEAIIPDSREVPQEWSYCDSDPGEGWSAPDFDDSGWMKGTGGFGTRFGKHAIIKTEWKERDMWLRKEFILEKVNWPLISIWYGEDCEIYINGVLACLPEGFNNCYGIYELNKAARSSLRAGRNVIAVHCIQRNKGGEQYIDIGLVDEIYD